MLGNDPYNAIRLLSGIHDWMKLSNCCVDSKIHLIWGTRLKWTPGYKELFFILHSSMFLVLCKKEEEENVSG